MNVPQLYDPWVLEIVSRSGGGHAAACENIGAWRVHIGLVWQRRKDSVYNDLGRKRALSGGCRPAIRDGDVEFPRIDVVGRHRRERK